MTPPRGEGVRPGALSALLQDLVRPEGPSGSDWSRALRPGARIGRFELVREVGRGGFGVVWEARDQTLGRTVAFKAVQARGDGPEEERVYREAEAAARLSHPNIVTLHDVGSCEHGPFLVLELLRGQTLAQRLAQGPVAVREAVRIALEVAKGLAHAHEHGVVHRDLTPGNVFLCSDGQVKILDLGMAQAFGRRKLEGGTPAYMAPEQSQGAPEDERTDVFALGVLLYRMLANELPFSERRKVLPASGSAPALEIAEAPALGPLVARMLARDPVQRPRDAGAVRDALAAMQQELDRTPSSSGVAAVRRRRRVPALAVAIVVAVLAGAVAAAIVLRPLGPRQVAPAVPSIAVLPFADMSPQKDQEYFADGLSEEILNALTHVDGLRVAGRTSSFSFKGTSEDLRAVGQKLGVGAVLEGSVRKAGNRVRITAQLINLSDGFHLWSETFDRELTDIFAVQDEIAGAVAVALRGKLVPAQPAIPRARSTDPEAYTQYLLGKQWYARFTMDGHRRAAAAFQRAVDIDPSYAPAWAALAVQLFNLSFETHEATDDGDRQRRRALAAVDRAIELDPQFGEAYATRGLLRGVLDWDWAGAQADVDRAVALSPGDATAVRRRALVLADVGRHPEALDAARRATELDPLFAANWITLGNEYGAAGDLKQARAALERGRQIAPEFADLDAMFAYLKILEGDAAGALSAFQQLRDEKDRGLGIAIAQHELGRRREAREALDTFVAEHGAKKPVGVAYAYAVMGDLDRAFEFLNRAYAQHDPALTSIKADWMVLPKIQGDPRFLDLIRKMNLPVTLPVPPPRL